MQEFENFELKNYTSFKIGGNAKKVYFPETIEEITILLKKLECPLVLGGMSNVLVSSAGINGDVILTKKLNKFEINGNKILAHAGCVGPLVSKAAAQNNLSGMEFMCGFPGTIGGILCMNAGAHEQCVADIFLSAQVFDTKEKMVKTFTKEDMEFGYRTSKIQAGRWIVLSAEFALQYCNQDNVLAKMQAIQEFRKNKQPNLSKPNCGSVFKNPKNDAAGRLLELAGVKNMSEGNAKVYENHANFIINYGNATSENVSKLMKKMYNKVNEKFGVKLIPEVKYIGEMNEVEKDIWNEFLNN